MFEDEKNDTFLSRWINDELSEAELSEFKNHPEYLEYQKIKQATDILDLSDYDEDTALDAIKTKIDNQPTVDKNKVVKLLWPYFAAAASIAIIFGFFFFNTSTTTIHSNYGEQLSVLLPDGSEMIVNTNSTASYDQKTWGNSRLIHLDGEAYFKVKKGSAFTVKTENGNVTVLGTQFNVNSVKKLFEVICYEGKVKVNTVSERKILTPELGFIKVGDLDAKDFKITQSQPDWMNKESTFRSIPIKYVFIELEKQYEITIKTSESIDQNTIYTGSFPHANLQVALKTVFSTLGMNYSLSKNGKSVVVNK